MPPKRVTMAPGTKQGTANGAQSTKGPPTKKDTKRSSLADANPIKRSSQTIGRAGDVRRQRDAYNAIIEEQQRETAQELQDLRDKIDYYRKDNEKIIRQQNTRFGMTLDNLKYVRKELEQARYTNDELYKELEARKEECEKLEYEMNSVIAKINELTLESSDLHREKRIYEKEREQLMQNDHKIHLLVNNNKALRNVLLQRKINPNTDASKMKVHTKSPKSDDLWLPHDPRFPKVYTRDNLLSVRHEQEQRTLPKRRLGRRPLKRTISDARDYVSGVKDYFEREWKEPYLWTRVVDYY